MAGRYEDGFPGLKASFYVHERLLDADMPDLFKKIVRCSVSFARDCY